VLPTSASVLEENIERVVDSVVRNINAGRGAVPDVDRDEADVAASVASATAESEATDGERDRESRETLADLYGHVAYALKSLESPPPVMATYKAPEPPAAAPTLNLIR
jgi:hypothetical protein